MTSPAPLRPKNAPAPSSVRRASAERFAASPAPQQLSASVRLGGAHDAEEHEAEKAAAAISAGGVHRVSDPGGAGHLRSHPGPKLLDPAAAGRIRSASAERLIDPGASGRLRRAASPGGFAEQQRASAAAKVEQARQSASRPLPETMRARLEHGFGQSLQSVRVHTGPSARAAAFSIGARAYTEGERITLGHGESEHDLGLMAHETTHVIQNRRAAGVFRPMPTEPVAETARRTMAATPEQGTVRPMIRRSIISRALDWLADKANYIPGFRLLTVALGFNPINGEKVERSGANILRAAISIIPLGELIVKALDQYNAFDKAGAFVDKEMKVLGDLGSSIKRALHEFLDSLGWTDVLHPGDVLERALRIFSDPAAKLIDFLKGLGEALIEFVRDAVLRPIAALVAKTPAWDILVGVFGKNPITGEPVESAAETVIGGLLKLAKQDAIFENMKKAHALSRIGTWFKSAVSELFGFVKEIPSLFIKVLKSFGIRDLLDLPGAIGRVIRIFGDFVGKFISWVGKTMWTILEIIFDVVSPTALSYIKKTGAALKSILKNPLPFVRNLVAAAKLGFNTFAENFGDHLKEALLDWLTGPLRGVYIPKAFSLIEFGKFALSVLELSWAQIRGKIVQALGPTGEKIMATLEKTFDVVTRLAQGGISAVWDLIKDNLANLKETLIDGIVGFVKGTIITKAVPKLLSLFIPGAGFISAIISIYDTIKVFIEKLSTIGQVVLAFVDSLASIAGGLIQAAAKRVDTALAGVISLAISFLAGFAQLGDIPEKVKDVIKKVKDPVDKAIGAGVGWVVGKSKAAFGKLFGKGDEKQSTDVKKLVGKELSGKTIKDTNEEKSLISSVYSRYAGLGLRGVRFEPSKQQLGTIDVIVSASLAEKVGQINITTREGVRELGEIIYNMTYYARRTSIYIFYDKDHKQFGDRITSRAAHEPPGHAEHQLRDVVQYQLMPLLRLRRGQNELLTPPGEKVPIHLDINRSPCDGCASSHLQDIINEAGAAFEDVPIALTISSAALSTEKGAQLTTVKGLKALLDAGVELTASTVWAEIEKQMNTYGVKQIEYAGKAYDFGDIAEFKAIAKEVQELIDKAKGNESKKGGESMELGTTKSE